MHVNSRILCRLAHAPKNDFNEFPEDKANGVRAPWCCTVPDRCICNPGSRCSLLKKLIWLAPSLRIVPCYLSKPRRVAALVQVNHVRCAVLRTAQRQRKHRVLNRKQFGSRFPLAAHGATLAFAACCSCRQRNGKIHSEPPRGRMHTRILEWQTWRKVPRRTAIPRQRRSLMRTLRRTEMLEMQSGLLPR